MKYTEYENFDSLKKHEEGCYFIDRIDRHSSIVILAPHGGRIEPGTVEIAREIARGVYSLYCFIGLRGNRKDLGDGRMESLHLPSYKFDEPEAVRLVKARKLALAVHGLKDAAARQFQGLDIYVGGLNPDARERVVANLKRKNFSVGDCMCAGFENFRHKGSDPKNIVNMCKGEKGGVQLEITRRERSALVGNGRRMKRFCDAIREALDSFV